MTIPRVAFVLNDADFSWNAVLNYAHERGLQFGKEIVFTYGPYGFLMNRYFFSHAGGWRMVADVIVNSIICGGVCWVAWRMRWPWRLLFLAIFVFVFANLDPRTEHLLEAGFLCWGVLCLVETGRRLAIGVAALTGLAVFATLMKVSFLFIGGVSVGLVAIDLILRRQVRLSLRMVAGFIGGMGLGWVVIGQKLQNLGPFIGNAVIVSVGYDQTMTMHGLPMLTARGIITCCLTGVAIAGRVFWTYEDTDKKSQLRRAVLLVWLSALLFIFWKHGFVREDLFHTAHLFAFATILVFVLEVLPGISGAGLLCARGVGIASAVIALFTLLSLVFPSNLAATLAEPLRAIHYNFNSLARPREYCQKLTREQEVAAQQVDLPRLRSVVKKATVDVFGLDQATALFNGLDYSPRPVFQSYVAYDRRLMRLNEEFYLSKDASEFVLFRLGALDRRFPPMDDAMAFRNLLINYEMVDAEASWLLLKRRSSSRPSLSLVKEGTVRVGEPISFASLDGTNCWVEVGIKPTLLGHLRQLVYKPPIVRLAIWRENSKAKAAWFRAPAPMLSAGFLVSPLFLRTEDVQNLYLGGEIVRPTDLSVELTPETKRFWESEIRYKVYRLENQLAKIRR